MFNDVGSRGIGPWTKVATLRFAVGLEILFEITCVILLKPIWKCAIHWTFKYTLRFDSLVHEVCVWVQMLQLYSILGVTVTNNPYNCEYYRKLYPLFHSLLWNLQVVVTCWGHLTLCSLGINRDYAHPNLSQSLPYNPAQTCRPNWGLYRITFSWSFLQYWLLRRHY